jgi:hypothetical protein
MSNITNEQMKKLIQRVVNKILNEKEFQDIKKIEIFFVFGSKTKSAFCNWAYGMKINSPKRFNDNFIISKIQRLIQSTLDKILDTKVCCTDVIFE